LARYRACSVSVRARCLPDLYHCQQSIPHCDDARHTCVTRVLLPNVIPNLVGSLNILQVDEFLLLLSVEEGSRQ